MTWALFALATHTETQNKLRSELSDVPTPNPAMDELNALPYLDGVIRETMRLHPPAGYTERAATTETVIPLDKPYVDNHGVTQTTLRYLLRVSV